MSVIGYAQADFATLVVSKKLYIDRTGYIQMLENESNTNLIFVRPRRFGKSLWLSILHYYYGMEHKDEFETLFGHLAIGQNPQVSETRISPSILARNQAIQVFLDIIE